MVARSSGRDWGWVLTGVMGAYALAFVAWSGLHLGGQSCRTFINDVAFLPVNLVGAGLALRVARVPGLLPELRRAWLIFALAFLCFWGGDVLSFYQEVFKAVAPWMPSAADLCYLLVNPLLLVGLLSVPSNRGSRSDHRRFLFDLATVLICGWMVIWYFVLGPQAHRYETGQLRSAINVTYVLSDVALAFALAIVWLRRQHGFARGTLSALMAGLGLIFSGDVAFGYLTSARIYPYGGWVDALFMAGQFLALVLAPALQYQALRSGAPRESAAAAAAPEPRTWRTLMPYGAVTVSYALLVAVSFADASYRLHGLVISAVAVTGVVVIRQFIVLRENAELRLAQARAYAEVQAVGRQREEFLSLVAHELRLPVAAIATIAESLADARGLGQAEQRAFLGLRRQARSLSRFADDVLVIARMETGSFHLNRVDLDLGCLLTGLVRENAEAGRIRLVLPPQRVLVTADPERLGQAVENLLGNALKYSGPEALVMVVLVAAAGEAELSVMDQGIGLSAAELQQLFTKYGRAPSAVRAGFDGVGLGLYLTQLLVAAHGGRVTAESGGPGQGATFRMHLPLRQQEQEGGQVCLDASGS